MPRFNSNEIENSNKTENSNETDLGNREFLSMFLGNFWAFLLMLPMLPSKLIEISSIIVDSFVINSFTFSAKIQFDSMSFT